MIMKTTITALLLGVSSLALVAASQPEPNAPQEKKTAEIGEKAPAFTLKDQHGRIHKLSDYEGKIVVLEWFNESCPFCMTAWGSGLLPNVLKDLGKVKTNVVYLAINSTANKPEEKVFESGKKFLEDIEISIPLLSDYDGEVGHTYGAKTTPHMFIIDTEGVLVYQGALSDDKIFKKGKKVKTHVLRAVEQIDAGEEVLPNYTKPWGCPVKYAREGKGKGNMPNRGINPAPLL
jgi:peroxiredoxin